MLNCELALAIDDFLKDWRLNNWMGLNPDHKPFSASSPIGVINLLRISVPACDGVRSARIAEAIREAGYAVIEDDAGVYIERCSKPAAQHPDEDSRSVHSTSAPLALASN